MKNAKPLTPRQRLLNIPCYLLVACTLILLMAIDCQSLHDSFAYFGAFLLSFALSALAYKYWYTPSEKEKRCASERIDWSASDQEKETF